MEIGKFYYSSLHDCYFAPNKQYTGDFIKGIQIIINEFYCLMNSSVNFNFNDINFEEITESEFYEKYKTALAYFNLNMAYENSTTV